MANLSRRGGWDPFASWSELGRWDPFRDFLLGRMLERGGGYAEFIPTFEVKETKDALIIVADVPGVNKEDIDVSLQGNLLTVSGKREEETKRDEENYHMEERSFGSFTRSFTLPAGIDVGQLSAELDNGVLRVVIPKGPEAKSQKVQIKGGAAGAKQLSAEQPQQSKRPDVK